MSLYRCSATDVTAERVQDLVGQAQPESLTLEYKERFTSRIVESIAAMANSYGGLILVGVTDKNGPDRLVGVPETTITQIVNACHEKLEPPWQPEIIPVPFSGDGGTLVLVVRVDADRAPRPILIDGAAYIRLHGRNAKADRGRLAQLFAELTAPAISSSWPIQAPMLPSHTDGSPRVDFMLRSGLVMSVESAASWRPLSESAVDELTNTLNKSALASVLFAWLGSFRIQNLNSFHRSGLNRARRARLVWQAVVDANVRYPIEAIAELSMPGSYGDTTSHLIFTIDVVARISSMLAEQHDESAARAWRLDIPDLYGLCDGLTASLVDPALKRALAAISGIEPEVVPQPTHLHFVTGQQVSDLLNLHGLAPIDEAGHSQGAHLVANPTYDLSTPAERDRQIDDWMQHIALDAGLRGMETLLTELHDWRNASLRRAHRSAGV
jgi:hypothetical protein